MFTLAIIIGIYSYLIFILGILGMLYNNNVIIGTALYIFFVCIFFFQKLQHIHIAWYSYGWITYIKQHPFIVLLLCLLVLQSIITFLGVLGPELAFDALWYHLALPKLYLLNHTVSFIPGGLLYYSAMPQLTEMLYVGALAFDGSLFAKCIHFSFGVLSLVALYKLSRIYLSQKFSLFAVMIFSANLVFLWESISAYIDLSRTFFEVLALWGFLLWVKEKKWKWIILSALMIGFAITTKLLAIGSIVIFGFLIIYNDFSMINSEKSRMAKTEFYLSLKNIIFYIITCLLIPLPWFIFSYLHTGNPVYPFFTSIYHVGVDQSLQTGKFLGDLWVVFTHADDPISPLYIIFAPLSFYFIVAKKSSLEEKLLFFYVLLSIIAWVVTPRTGGGRFLLPYLPAFSVLVAWTIARIKKIRVIYLFSVGMILLVSFSSLLYRGAANAKFVPVIFGKETQAEFLKRHLNFSFGDFYDSDGYFRQTIKATDTVLLVGFHNLYYVNFPFVDSSWIQKGTRFNYVAVQNATLPKQFAGATLVYENKTTHVTLYKTGWLIWDY